MADKLHFLYIEDNPLDAEIIEDALRNEWSDCDYTVIGTEKELSAALVAGQFDIILADRALPGYDGLAALSYVLEHSPETPFIFLSGTMGEEAAVETLKNGATDYILKSSLSKLIPAIYRALRDRRIEEERQRVTMERERLLSIVEATRNELFLFSADTLQFVYANPSALRNLGYSMEQLQALTPIDITSDFTLAELRSYLTPLLDRTDLVRIFETFHRRADGTIYPIEVSLQLADSHGQQDKLFLAVINDISLRKESEKELKRNLERLELMQVVSQYHAANVQDLLDFSLEKIIALTDSDIGYIYHYHADEEKFVLNSWSRGVLAACNVIESQTIYPLKNTGLWGEVVRQQRAIMVNDYTASSAMKKGYPEGHVPLTRFLSIPVFDNGQIVAVVGVANKEAPYDQSDLLQLTLMMEGVWKIVARLNLEEQVSKAGHEWQGTFDSISDSISLIDADQLIKRCNQATCQMLHLDFSGILHQPCWKVFHGTEGPLPDCPMTRAKRSLRSETSTVQKEGHWLEVTVDPILSEKGVMTGAVHIVRDVTERVNLANSIKEVSDLFRLFMKHSPVYTFIKEVTDDESRILAVSDNYHEMLDIDGQEVIGKTMHELFPQAFADKITVDDQRVVARKEILRLEESFNGGSYISYKFPIERSAGRRLVAGYTIDISELKKTEEALRKSQELLEATARIAHMGGWEYNLISGELTWTKEIYRIHEVAEDFVPTLEAALSFYTPEAVPIISTAVERAIEVGEPFDLELSLLTAQGRRRLVRSIGQVKVRNGATVKVYGTFHDITEERSAEEALRDIQAQLIQADKLASIGQLAAGVAHEINNPLGFVSSNMGALRSYIEKYHSYIDLIEEELRTCSVGILPQSVQDFQQKFMIDYIRSDISGLIDENNEGLARVKRIVLDLRTFSRTDSFVPEVANLNQCLDSTINIVNNEIKYVAELKRDYGELPKVTCNIQQINQVFMNLLVNATHAIQSKGEELGIIAVRSWSMDDNVFVSIADTGCGIPLEIRGKIFEAFFTTKQVGKGTGLGLSISAEIVRKHGGELSVESEVGVGTTFTVRLPLSSPPVSNNQHRV